MRSGPCAFTTGYLRSLRLLAVAACLWPAIAGAQPPDPTASDADFNTAAGSSALLNVTGSANTAIGDAALQSNTTGNNNTASGFAALFNNTTGDFNTASGFRVLQSNTTGNDNTASGVEALFNNTTGSGNTASGFEALGNNTTGINNTALGTGALAAINGNNNIAVGVNAGKNTPSGSSNIYIGNAGTAAGESLVTRIGRNQTKAFFAGIAGVPVSGATVVVRSDGQLGVIASSARYKRDIHPLGDGAPGKLAQLRPVSFRYKSEPQATHYGLIAEEVDKVMPELVVRDGKGRPESVQYIELIPLLLQDRRQQQARIEKQATRIEKQAVELTRQRALIEQLATEVAELRATRFAGSTK